MGMDGVELVMITEEAFDVEITDAEAERILTPGQLVALIEQKLGTESIPSCLSRRAFYLLRRHLMMVSAAARNAIQPGLRLDGFYADSDLPAKWKTLREATKANVWPELQLSSSVHSAVALVAIMMAIGAWLVFASVAGRPMAGWIGGGDVLSVFCLAAVFAVFAYRWIPLPRASLPSSVSTLGDLARFLVANDPELLSLPPQWSHERITLKVREIVCDVLGCDDCYREDAKFVEDLGLS